MTGWQDTGIRVKLKGKKRRAAHLPALRECGISLSLHPQVEALQLILPAHDEPAVGEGHG